MGMFGSRGGMRFVVPVKPESWLEEIQANTSKPLIDADKKVFIDLRQGTHIQENRNEKTETEAGQH